MELCHHQGASRGASASLKGVSQRLDWSRSEVYISVCEYTCEVCISVCGACVCVCTYIHISVYVTYVYMYFKYIQIITIVMITK